MGKPQPGEYATGAEYRWAAKQWSRRTGGSLLGTVALAAVIGALTGSAAVVVLLVVAGVALHLYVRSRDAGPKLGEMPIERRCDLVEAALLQSPADASNGTRQEAEALLRAHRPDSPALAHPGSAASS